MTDVVAEKQFELAANKPSVYRDFSDDAYQTELSRVMAETEIEREWITDSDIEPYKTDADILADVDTGKLVRVNRGSGFIAIQSLAKWEPARSNPNHPFYYSPPYLKPQSFDFLCELGDKWQQEMGSSRFLAVTSLVRSIDYQTELAARPRKITVVSPELLSSHVMGWSFDIDGCGLYEAADNGDVRAINPRNNMYKGALATESRLVLKSLLADAARSGVPINFVEELPGTAENCFHVCVKPEVC